MGERTGIEWADHTFNPWWGCEKVSPACANCYAEGMAARFGTEWGPNVPRRLMGDDYWKGPLSWDRKAKAAGVKRRVFCASMADVFEDREDLSDARARLWQLIEKTPNLVWMLLTKRPENVHHLIPGTWRVKMPGNVWMGVTVEDQERADERIPRLLKIKAGVRFLSCEPLLGPLDFDKLPIPGTGCKISALRGIYGVPGQWHAESQAIHWVICGGESDPKGQARPMNPAWAQGLRRDCEAAGVPFFFKQWGEWAPLDVAKRLGLVSGIGGGLVTHQGLQVKEFDLKDVGRADRCKVGTTMWRIGAKKTGSLLDGVDHKAIPVMS